MHGITYMWNPKKAELRKGVEWLLPGGEGRQEYGLVEPGCRMRIILYGIENFSFTRQNTLDMDDSDYIAI